MKQSQRDSDGRELYTFAVGRPDRLGALTPARWAIVVAPDLKIACRDRPSTWGRFWARVLLGWRWELLR